ncbi:unnamed protein product [Lactuca saligna]|uniref:ATP-dependent DNA helicase n=1 Tax=Lactuca saligna TaxID=75948 RepID=A0AA35YES3_LACSI|nr:unnamed protein product [Lactuca saligna]
MSIYRTIVGSIEHKKQVLMFVYGHGGTGKTFLWSMILSYFRSIGKVVLDVAASGIASLLLPSGTNAHSRFKIPIDLTNKKSCDIKKRTILGDLMCHTSLIEKPFGGLSVLLGGDLRQTLPVVPKSTRSETIALTLPKSYLWRLFQRWFGWIPDTDDPDNTSWVQIPDSLLIPPGPNVLQDLIQFVYGDSILINPTAKDLSERTIVCPTNEVPDKINNMILETITASGVVYNNTDSMQPNGKHTADPEGLYPTDYLNELIFPGIPPHVLHLKQGAPIMLLRNMNQKEGLCNANTFTSINVCLPNSEDIAFMTCISDMKCEGVGAPLQLRIIRKWKNNGDAIQILGQRTSQTYNESVFKLFDCYTIFEYSCPELDRHQKVLENDFYIKVGLISVIKSLPDTMTIPKHWFRFVTKSHLMELGEKPPYYPDFISVLSKTKDCRKANHEPYVFLVLTEKSGNELPINLWNECITVPTKFNRDLLIPLPTITVVAVTNLKASTSASMALPI